MQFYCGHQSKVRKYKKVSTNKLLIMANLIYITLILGQLANEPKDYLDPELHDIFVNSVTIRKMKNGTNVISTSLEYIYFSKVIGFCLKK